MRGSRADRTASSWPNFADSSHSCICPPTMVQPLVGMATSKQAADSIFAPRSADMLSPLPWLQADAGMPVITQQLLDRWSPLV